ncbi:MAG TPA: PEGA domain-containing protein [Gammaproteobacteria bacterium]|nr:PEGA domain-containing protein [Gammaproteobacteria bacterium]
MKQLFIPLIAVLLSACATVTKGTTDEVIIQSQPSGANITTTLGYHGVTPAKIEHKRKKAFTATIEIEGYKPAKIFIDTRLADSGAAGLAGNILVGGVIGLAIDGISGSSLDHYPDDVLVKLVPVSDKGEASVIIRTPKAVTPASGDDEDEWPATQDGG